MSAKPTFDEGVYIYSGGKPVKQLPPSDRPLIIYFDNRKCMFCRRFDPKWEALAKSLNLPQDPVPVRVVCTFFANDCRDEHAKKLFEEHEVSVTPLLVFSTPQGGRRKLLPQRLWETEVEDLILLLRSLSQGF